MPIARFVVKVMMACVVLCVVGTLFSMKVLGKMQLGGSALVYSINESVYTTRLFITGFNTFSGLPTFSQFLATDLPFADNPACSPNGDYIAFYSMNLYITDIYGNHLERLTNAEEMMDRPFEWLPDGHRIAFTRNAVGNISTTVYLWDINTHTETLFYSASNIPVHPNWSPDGRQIIYTLFQREPLTAQIYVSDADGDNAVRLTTDDETLYYGPRWSPDGSKIVFFTAFPDQYVQTIYSLGIYIMNNDGSEIQQLTDMDAYNPVWSPDGNFVAFGAIVDGQFDIFVINVNNHELRQISNDIYWESVPCWLP